MTNSEKIGHKLQALRKEHNLSQEELSDKLAVSRQAISKWERGEAYPDTENLIAISKLFNVSIDELIDNQNEKTSDSPLISKKGKILLLFLELPYPILITIIYLIWGFVWEGWHIGWTLYVTIPVYYTLLEAIRYKNPSKFAYPCLIAFAYLLCGMAWNLWHPLWIIFLTIPIYYPIVRVIKKQTLN